MALVVHVHKTMFDGHWMTGGVVSAFTVMVKMQVLRLVQSSVAVQVTVVRRCLRAGAAHRDDAHRFAESVFESRQSFKCRICLYKTIIERLIIGIENHFDNTETFVNRVEDSAIFFF